MNGRLAPLNSTIDGISRRLREIGYQVERIQNQALLLPPGRMEPQLGTLENRLEDEWRLLCLRFGFETPAQQPPLPSDPRNLLLSSSHVYQDMVMAHTRDTLLTPRNPYLVVSPIPSPELTPQNTRITEEPETQDTAHMLDSITLGEAGRPPGNQSQRHGNVAIPIDIAEMYAVRLNAALLLTSLG
jgi:hypothetical protein